MTERWRKRLGDLDKVGPGDDVFHRAADGPQLPDAMIPRPSTSSRIVTGIAAFLVFALAISVFAIPALRMHDQAGSLGQSMLPLWPVRTLDDAESLQRDASSGASGWALDPGQVSLRFGQQVLGWTDASARSILTVSSYCLFGGEPSTTSAPVPVPCSSSGGYARATNVSGDFGGTYDGSFEPFLGSESMPPTLTPGTATPFDPYQQWLVSSPGRIPVTVTLFQPLESGDGRVWTVLSAASETMDLSVMPGDIVRNGGSVSVSARIPDGDSFGFGVRIGSGACDQRESTASYHSPGSTGPGYTPVGSQMQVDFGSRPDGSPCGEEEPGYVFAATSRSPLVGDGLSRDPLDGGGPALSTFVAVPIVFSWPAASPSAAAGTSGPPLPVETSSPAAWTTYTDPLGWTIDVPSNWKTASFDQSGGRVSVEGAWLSSGSPTVIPGDSQGPGTILPASGEVMLQIWNAQGGIQVLPTNDSGFPLSADDVLAPAHSLNSGGWASTFRGDGLEFTITVRAGDNAPSLTSSQEVIVRRMVASIRFQPWSAGETRNGWTTLSALDTAPAPTWMGLDGGTYVAFVDSQGAVSLYGPAPSCVGGETATSDASGNAVLECPDGSSMGWDSTGQPIQEVPAPPPYQPLDRHPVVTAQDGSLIAELGATIS